MVAYARHLAQKKRVPLSPDIISDLPPAAILSIVTPSQTADLKDQVA